MEEGSLYPDELASSLRHMEARPGATGECAFDREGGVVRECDIYIVREGALIPWGE
jgi:hypothetical protein